MVTKNWYRLASLLVFATDATSASVVCKNIKGNEYPISSSNKLGGLAMGYATSKLLTEISTGSGVYGTLFGTGDTPPALEDYTLAGDVISEISMTASRTTIGNAADAEYAEVTTTYTLANTGTAEITVREVALVVYSVMLERTVLDEPVTIPAGGIGQVTYTIRMNYPTT